MSLIFAALVQRIRQWANSLITKIALLALAGVLALFGFGWAVVAGTIFLADRYGAVAACLIVAVAAIVAAGVVYLIFASMGRSSRSSRPEKKIIHEPRGANADRRVENRLVRRGRAIAPVLVKASPVVALVIVAATGYVLARNRTR